MANKNILTRSKQKKALALLQGGRFREAQALLEQVCRSDRQNPEAWFYLGATNGRLGRHADAAACLRKAAALRPNHAPTHHNLGITLRETGRWEEAAAEFHKTIDLDPLFSDAHESLAHVLLAQGKLDEASAAFKVALHLQPGKAELHSNIGSIYQSQSHLEEALSCYREAQRLKPGIGHENMGSVFSDQGRFKEAMTSYREALRLDPGNTHAHSNLLLTLNYMSDQKPAEILLEHQAWDKAHGLAFKPWKPHTNHRDPERRLKIGYVSPDFRTHSVACFFEPLLINHNREEVEIFCYSSVTQPDETTEQLQVASDHWRDISRRSDVDTETMIRTDGIDILIDLAGHTSGNHMPLFARKPAPVQVTWLGYPNTTGLTAIDYRLTDTLADPKEQDPYYVEELIRLPGCFLCYLPPEKVPDVSPLPALEAGYVTFGSFNNLAKISPQAIELWSKILKSIPDAKLLLKSPSLTDTTTREHYAALFTEHGIANDRLQLMGHTQSRADHLALYGKVDIALDTFPYNGTTTTCESLWMGVPVVTLEGVSHAGRVSTSLLIAAGFSEWATKTPEQYHSKAVELALDGHALAKIRAGLRSRIAASSLCKGEPFARKIEDAYRDMWLQWCQS